MKQTLLRDTALQKLLGKKSVNSQKQKLPQINEKLNKHLKNEEVCNPLSLTKHFFNVFKRQ